MQKLFAKGIVPEDCEVHIKLHPALIIIRRLSELGLAAGSKYT
jgi:hypothetical protein